MVVARPTAGERSVDLHARSARSASRPGARLTGRPPGTPSTRSRTAECGRVQDRHAGAVIGSPGAPAGAFPPRRASDRCAPRTPVRGPTPRSTKDVVWVADHEAFVANTHLVVSGSKWVGQWVVSARLHEAFVAGAAVRVPASCSSAAVTDPARSDRPDSAARMAAAWTGPRDRVCHPLIRGSPAAAARPGPA